MSSSRTRLHNTGSACANAERELAFEVLSEARRFAQVARNMRDMEPFPDARTWMRGYAFAAQNLAQSIRHTIRWHMKS